MSTFYMVEMNYAGIESRVNFDAFYHKHISMLLTIEGFRTAQRFECSPEAKAPFLAVYQLTGPEVMTSEGYTSRAGRTSVDPKFRVGMADWDRNLVSGDVADLIVPMGGQLIVIDRLSADSPALPAGYASLSVVGLDETVVERGVKLGQAGDAAPDEAAGWTVRAFKPIHPVRRSS